MISFANDYSEGCAPEILDRLQAINFEQNPGYGEDKYCLEAAEQIKQLIESPESAVHFLVGGTQTNLVAIAAALRPHEAVICVDTGHVNVHETGAIEAIGHKLLVMPGRDGKLVAEEVDQLVQDHIDDISFEHMAKPRLIYISNTTEIGTIYSEAELAALREVADKRDLLIYLDGARLGSAMTAKTADTTWTSYSRYCDAFSIGGTKNGLLFGEALVIKDPAWQKDFRYIQKQKGAILAKSWLIGLQYSEILRDDKYLKYAAHANRMAERLAESFVELGLELVDPACSNQTFVYLPLDLHHKLREEFIYEPGLEDAKNNRVSARFCTSWATKKENVDQLIQRMKELLA
ncbi:MAG: aminotransferase class I/II-fold pyridoxal phosphate-dependent enzyme [Eubacteriales bacterium]|nr:aminotransferase class I/II-fold pyridoxal phosphate-dependent enzyme [Eubacteriales bacterium]